MSDKKTNNDRAILEIAKKTARVFGICMALPFFLWLPLGLIPAIPSIVEVFGIDGLRIPTGIVIGGLMLAAFGFEDF